MKVVPTARSFPPGCRHLRIELAQPFFRSPDAELLPQFMSEMATSVDKRLTCDLGRQLAPGNEVVPPVPRWLISNLMVPKPISPNWPSVFRAQGSWQTRHPTARQTNTASSCKTSVLGTGLLVIAPVPPMSATPVGNPLPARRARCLFQRPSWYRPNFAVSGGTP